MQFYFSSNGLLRRNCGISFKAMEKCTQDCKTASIICKFNWPTESNANYTIYIQF